MSDAQEVNAANLVSKMCCECYCVQPLVNTVCCLCGVEPFIWLPAAETPTNREMDSLRELAANGTIDQLKTMLRSGWSAYGPERERVAKNLLAAKIRRQGEEERRAAFRPEPSPARVSSKQVKSAIRYCEIKEDTLSRELAEMKARSGSEQIPAEPPAVPWFEEPEYLKEKLEKEQARADTT